MSLYELFLTLHLIAAVIWLGAAFVLSLLILRAELAGDRVAKAEINSQSEWLALRLFVPSSFATLIFGVALVAEGSWDLDSLWVAIGLGGWLASFLTGILYFKTEGERVGALVAEHGPDYPEVERRLDTMEAVGRIELALLFLIVADMVAKPTGDDGGLLIAGAALLAGVAVVALRALRSSSTRAA